MTWLTDGTFWLSAAERAVSTAAQAAVAVIGTDLVVSAVSVDWYYTASVALGAGILSVLKGIAATYVGDKGTPSLVRGGE
jgi:hypothetical protein